MDGEGRPATLSGRWFEGMSLEMLYPSRSIEVRHLKLVLATGYVPGKQVAGIKDIVRNQTRYDNENSSFTMGT